MAFTKLFFFAAAWSLVACRTDVEIESAPYIASVHIGSGESEGSFICAAVIIHEQFVLTTASSLIPRSGNSSFNVVVGTTGVGDSDGELYKVVNAVFHHKYETDSETLEYNVALLKLEQPITMGPTVQTIEYASDYDLGLKEDDVVTITGWFDEINGASADRSLSFRQEQVSFYEDSTCNSFCNETIEVTEKQVCTAFYCRDLAAREGSALTYNGQLIGINSMFWGCNQEAAVFVKLSSFACWIEGVIDGSLSN